MGEGSVSEPGIRGRIFYVDDDPALTQLVTRELAKQGYEVTGESDASRALERFVASPEAFDAVVTDIGMPAMPGLELARRLLAVRPTLPVLLLSGWAGPEEIEQARAIGVRSVIVKAGTITELCRGLCEQLSRDLQ